MEIPPDHRKREETIAKWMLSIVNNGGVRRLDDLHINRIDSVWHERTLWVEGGIAAFRIARVLRDRNRLPFTVAVAFSLTSSKQPRGVDFRNLREFRDRLDRSPPSLYLFEPGEGPRNKTVVANAAQDLDSSLFAIQEAGVSCYYLEFLQHNADEYSRSVFIEDKPGKI